GGVATSLLTHPELETLYVAQFTWVEAMYIVDNRLKSWVNRGRLTQDDAGALESVIKTFAASRCTIIAEPFYQVYEMEGRRRIPDDPDDWHPAALAMATETAIWTLDQRHFFGCGLVVWKTSILRIDLAAST